MRGRRIEKTGIFSYNFCGISVNLGTVLQPFVLRETLDHMGIDNEIKDHISENSVQLKLGFGTPDKGKKERVH